LFWIDTGLKLPPSIQIKRVRLKCDINAGEVLMSLFFFFGSVGAKKEVMQGKQRRDQVIEPNLFFLVRN